MPPQILHIIWIGKPLPAKYINNLKLFIKNSEKNLIEIFVWHDVHSQLSLQNLSDCLTTDNLKLLSIKSVIEFGRQQAAYIKFLVESVIPQLAAAEHFAAIADILRLLILLMHGGMYCDLDLMPANDIEIFLPVYGFCVRENKISLSDEVKNIELLSLNNDIIISNPGHQLLFKILETIYNRLLAYRDLRKVMPWEDWQKSKTYTDWFTERLQDTIWLFGPETIRHVLINLTWQDVLSEQAADILDKSINHIRLSHLYSFSNFDDNCDKNWLEESLFTAGLNKSRFFNAETQKRSQYYEELCTEPLTPSDNISLKN